MEQKISPVVQPQQLAALKQMPDFVLIDARAGAGMAEKYAAAHLQGALHVDLDRQLADIQPDAANGGRHPLPSPAQFAQVLMQVGISPDSHVVVYDDKNGANAAARFWWMLKAAGHPKVQVLDGGMDAAIQAGFPVNRGTETPANTGEYEITDWTLPLSDLEEVQQVTQNGTGLVIDVRDAARYRGEVEPIDLIAGHIPGATNIPFTDNLDAQGFFLAPDILRAKYEKALEGRNSAEVIVHCGSGVTACHTLLAMDYAGMDIPKLYVGSWSEWSRRDLPIATGVIA